MKDWERAEKEVARLLGGTLTPGSGNKGIKGDIRVGKKTFNNWHIEVKQTAGDKISLKASWLLTLEQESLTKDVALVISFGLRLYVYIISYDLHTTDKTSWGSMTIQENNLPDYIIAPTGTRWCRVDMVELIRIVKGKV